MDAIFMKTKNKIPNKKLNLSDKAGLMGSDKYVALSNLSIYYAWKNIEGSYRNNKPKIGAPIWNEKFESPCGSYSVSDVQDYFEYIIKKHVIDSD